MINNRVSLKSEMRGLQVCGLMYIREMKSFSSEGGEFAVASDMYRSVRREHLEISGQRFPERVDRIYREVMLPLED